MKGSEFFQVIFDFPHETIQMSQGKGDLKIQYFRYVIYVNWPNKLSTISMHFYPLHTSSAVITHASACINCKLINSLYDTFDFSATSSTVRRK